jgi:uncharacterized membrane protein (UPF0182 family)
MKGFDAFYMVGELSEDGEWQWNGTEWIPAQPQNNHQSELMEHVPEKSGVASRILMGLIGILMSLVIAAVSFYHRYEIMSADLTSPDFVPVRDSMEILSALLALVIVLALVTIICSILVFIGLGFSKKALLGSSTIMLVVLLICVWMEWSILQTIFGDSSEYTTNWRMNPLTMPPTLFAYCNLAGVAVMALIARLSRAKRGSSLKLEGPF